MEEPAEGEPHSTFHESAAEAEEWVEDGGSPEVTTGDAEGDEEDSQREEDEVDGDEEEDVSEFDGEVDPGELMETYYQGLKARKHLRKM